MRRRPSWSVPALALATTTVLAPGTAAAAVPTAPAGAVIATTQVVATTRVAASATPDFGRCTPFARAFDAAARGGRVYDVDLDEDAEHQGQTVLVTCRVRFVGRAAPAALAAGVRAAAVRWPRWTFTTARDSASGVLFVVTLPRSSSHALLSRLNDVGDRSFGAHGGRSCAGGDLRGVTVLRVASARQLPAAAVGTARAGVARAAGVPATAVRIGNPWTAPESLTCVRPSPSSFTSYR